MESGQAVGRVAGYPIRQPAPAANRHRCKARLWTDHLRLSDRLCFAAFRPV